jgi:hypothetical protein
MPNMREMPYAEAFAGTLFSPGRGKPEFLVGPNGKGAERRFEVYRNNVSVGLVNALASMFPATQRIVGEEFFRAMARRYVRDHPPRSRLLVEYGQDLATFIAGFKPLAGMPWLADVAKIERAWLDAYHAADAAPLVGEELAAIPENRLVDTILVAHPAARLVRSRHAAVTIFSVNRREGEVGAIETDIAEDALITRPHLDVAIRILPAGGAVFLETLFSGHPLGEAAAAALAECPTFDLGVNIAGMIEAGALADIRQ